MKQLQLTTAAHRLAAVLAIATALATSGAWAADVKWTGAENNNWGNTNNWRDKASDRPLPTNDNMIFDSQYYNNRFIENEVVFDGAYVNGWRTLIHNVGTAEAPLVFRATAPENGLQFGNSNKWNNEFGYDTGDVYLRLENGTWSTGSSEKGTLLGGSSTSCYLTLTDGATFSVGQTLTIANGELNLTGGSTFSTGSTLTIANGELNLTGGSTFSTASGQTIFLDNAASKVTISGGSTLTGGRYFCLRAGEVTVENATLQNTAHNFELGQTSAVTLTLNASGVLEIMKITYKNNNNTVNNTVLLNGGEIKASVNNADMIDDNSNNTIVVKVGEGGGAINANGLAVKFPRPIAPDGANDGGMTFKGGGSVSLKYANTYTGATKVELGTKIIATTEAAKNSLLGNLVVTGVAADGDYYVFEYSGLTDADLANVTCPGGAAGTTITRDGNQIKVHYVAPAVDLGWNGGDAAWATANAWTNATGTAKTWTDGNYAVFEDASTVTLGANATAVAATFNADATVAMGGGTLTVPTVTVASGVSATIAAPTAGALEKTGAGTLTLGSSRTDATTLTEGTLAMAPGATLAALTLGTDSAKPVTFDYGGGTYATKLAAIESGLDITLKNGAFALDFIKDGTLRTEAGATVTANNDFYVGYTASATGTLTLDGAALNVVRNLCVGTQSGSTGDMALNSGSVAANRFVIGQFGTGTLTINGGTAEVRSSDGKAYVGKYNGTVTLNGGTLIAKTVIHDGGTSSLVFNGGTLKANAVDRGGLIQSAIPVTVNAGGGTIDAATLEVTVKATSVTGAGGMKYAGGGSVTYSVQPAYTGVTTVEVGTTLVVPAAIAGEKLAFTVPAELADGVYTVVSISGDSQFADNVLSGKAEGFVLSGDKKKICYVKGMDTTKPIYIGTDGDLSAAGNWLGNTIPTGGTGEAQVFCATAATLTVGDTFAPAKLIIPDGSALVTIGAGTLCVNEVVNRQFLAVGTGATVVIGDQLTLAAGESLCDQNNGTLVVSNLLLKAENGDRFVTEHQAASSSGIFKFNAVTNSMTDNWFYLADKSSVASYEFYIGEGGLNFKDALGSAGYCLGHNRDGISTTIRPWYSDFTIADKGTGDYSLVLLRNVTFCTDDENGVGRTITIDAKTQARYSPAITVSGTGTLQVNSMCDNRDEPTVTVTDTATLAFGAGASLGTGAITLGAGTKLVLTQPSGSNEFTPLVNTLNLPTGENEVATIRIDGERLKSGDHVIATVGNEATTANVALAPASAALDGRKYTLKVENDKLKLNIESAGLMLIFR